MKYKLLSVSKYAEITRKIGVNIGDYIQALASSQFLPRIDGFIDRDEELKDYKDDECKLIMNGWYMHEPENWPPSDKINPLFVAFHINSVAKDSLLSDDSIAYLKKYEPIGCRDTNTMNILKSKGVDAYFSACMTLTLGYKYHSDIKDNTTYIVDPLYDCNFTINTIAKGIQTMLCHPLDIYDLLIRKRLDLQHGRNVLKRVLKAALYYREYVKVFGRAMVMESEYIYQDNSYYLDVCNNDTLRLNKAEELVKKYARAKLVVTSRIHCALPCLGLDTPVVYIDRQNDSESSKCRLNGLKELFNCVTLSGGKLHVCFNTKLPIDVSNVPVNKPDWKKYASELIDRCNSFMK